MRWLDPQQHDGTASPDNFIMALHDALINNLREMRYDHPAMAERFAMAEDAKSATFWLRPGLKFHDGSPVTPDDVKWSYEHYRGAWGEVLHDKTQGVEVIDDRTVRFHFREPFLDFPVLLGTGNVCGAAWVVPAKYYETVGQDGFMQKPIGAGPYKLVSRAVKLNSRPLRVTTARPTSSNSQCPVCRKRRRGVAMLERGADIIYNVPGDDRPGQKQPEADAGASRLGQFLARISGLSGPQARSTTSVCARRSVSR